MKKIFRSGVFVLLMFACGENNLDRSCDNNYMAEIVTWRKQRVERLKSSTGWLTLAGLFWLEKGQNSFGSDKNNDVVFPAKAPQKMGVFDLSDGEVHISINPNVRVQCDGQTVPEMQLQSDKSGKPTVLTWGSLSWYVIERSGRFGIRLKDSDSPILKNFKGIDNYPIQAEWHLAARFEKYQPVKKIAVPNVLGNVTEESCPGVLVFGKDGQTFKLEPIDDGSEALFVIFSDLTNGDDTYGAGRFLYVEMPDSSGKTFIDFNKTYNPPCAFTPFATCPLPPQQNRLSIKVTAGEKYHGAAH